MPHDGDVKGRSRYENLLIRLLPSLTRLLEEKLKARNFLALNLDKLGPH